MLEGQACAQDDQCLGGACGGGKCASELVILPELRMGGTVFAGQLGGILFNVWNRSGVEQAPFEMVLVASPPTLRFDWPEPSQPCGSSPLPHTGGCRVGVAGFLPSAGQSVSATVEARRGGRVLARARWSAEVVPAGAPELRGGDLGENPVGTSSRAQEVELFAGASAIRPTRYFIEGRDAAEFEVVHNLCPARLEAGAWCFITLELSPAALGTRSARLVVEGDGFRAAAPLLGYGIPKPP